jgi:cytochrome c oxidase subunit 2
VRKPHCDISLDFAQIYARISFYSRELLAHSYSEEISLMKFITKTFLALALATVAAIGAGAVYASAHPPIDIVAANWKFTPSTVTVPLAEATTFHLTSSGGVHGLKSDDLGIAQTTIQPGKFVDVTFTPKKAGTYKIACSIFCGPGHANMALTVVVK